MAIAFDTVSNGNASATTSITWSHTATGSNLVVYVAAIISTGDGIDPSSSATYGGEAMAKLDSVGLASSEVLVLFRKAGPLTGAQTVLVSWTGSFSAKGGSASYTGVDQTTPEGTPVKDSTNAATTATIDVSSAADKLVVDFLANRNATDAEDFVAGGGQTERLESDHSSANFLHMMISEETGAATTTMSWSWTTSSRRYQIGISVNPSDAIGDPYLGMRSVIGAPMFGGVG